MDRAGADAASRRLRASRGWGLRLIAAVWVVFVSIPWSQAQALHAVASAHPLASAAGEGVLERGGNAFDAAVAVAAALAVVEPYSSGLGGGGFFLLHRAGDGREVMIDARETAPAAAREQHYLDSEGRPLAEATTRGGRAVAVPGLAAGLVHLAARYGSLPLEVLLAPAIRLARDGFEVDPRYARIAQLREAYLREGEGTLGFLSDGRAPAPGTVLRQADLAATLERIVRFGRAGFYEGPVARALVDTVNAAGGHWTLEDLRRYRVVERAPVRFTYRGAVITAAALPSAGGVALAQTLGMLERLPPVRIGEPAGDHLVAEALRRAFRDRTRYLGDPDFVAPPLERLLSDAYLTARADEIDSARATRSEGTETRESAESRNTTHLSVIDAHGNRVAATLTINLLFGSGIVGRGTGVLLNNEMDDFSLGPEVANAFSLRGGPANRIEPRKRPLSSMTPTFVEDEKGVLVLGAPGGSRIISQVLIAVLQHVHAREVDLASIVRRPRYHHQHWPDRLEIEPAGFGEEWKAAMEARGHRVQVAKRPWGNMQAVFKARGSGLARAASDPRGQGVAWY